MNKMFGLPCAHERMMVLTRCDNKHDMCIQPIEVIFVTIYCI